MPQLVIRGDDLGGVHQACGDVGDVALETHQGPGPGDGCLIEDLVSLAGGDKTRVLGTLLALFIFVALPAIVMVIVGVFVFGTLISLIGRGRIMAWLMRKLYGR